MSRSYLLSQFPGEILAKYKMEVKNFGHPTDISWASGKTTMSPQVTRMFLSMGLCFNVYQRDKSDVGMLRTRPSKTYKFYERLQFIPVLFRLARPKPHICMPPLMYLFLSLLTRAYRLQTPRTFQRLGDLRTLASIALLVGMQSNLLWGTVSSPPSPFILK